MCLFSVRPIIVIKKAENDKRRVLGLCVTNMYYLCPLCHRCKIHFLRFLLFLLKNPFLPFFLFFERLFYFLVAKMFNPTKLAKRLHTTTFRPKRWNSMGAIGNSFDEEP